MIDGKFDTATALLLIPAVTFDYGGRRLFLQPNGRRDAPHRFDASGVHFEQSPRGFVVENVLPDTAAA